MKEITIGVSYEMLDTLLEEHFKETILDTLKEIREFDEAFEPAPRYQVKDYMMWHEFIEGAKKVWSWISIEPFPSLEEEDNYGFIDWLDDDEETQEDN